MTAWGYQVHSITLDNYDKIANDLQEALNKQANNTQQLVSCFPRPERLRSESDQMALTRSEGSSPYHDVLHEPTGPSFIAIYKPTDENGH